MTATILGLLLQATSGRPWYEEPAFLAALVAAAVALVNIIQTGRNQSRQRQFEASLQDRQNAFEAALHESQTKLQTDLKDRELLAEERRAARKELQALALLAGRVLTSVWRLIELSPSRNDNRMMEDTAHTLGIVADFFNATDQGFQVTAPEEVKAVVKKVRNDLAALFLEMEMKFERRQDAPRRLQPAYSKLEADMRELENVITTFVRPDLDKLA